MGMYAIIVGALAGIIIVGASFFALSQKNTEPSERARATSFGESMQVFDIFKKPQTPQNEHNDATPTPETPQDDRIALQALADAWAKRRIDLEKAFPAPAPTEQPTAEPTTPQDIFTNLLGPKITDALNQNTHTNTSSSSPYSSVSFNGEASLWGGTTEVPPQKPIQPVDTTYEIQKELRAYGNTLGATLTQFLQAQGDQTATLSFYLDNRTETIAKEKLKTLTDAYATFSDQLAAITTAPAPLAQNHTNLVSGYARIGTELWAITDATTDGELYNKLIAYNAVAEDVARYHIAVTTILKAYGVTFAPGEPGNAFVFDGAQGTEALSL